MSCNICGQSGDGTSCYIRDCAAGLVSKLIHRIAETFVCLKRETRRRIILPISAAMVYAKGILSGLAALFLAELVPGSWSIFRGMSTEKATGLAAVAGGLVESIFSPLFWILAALFFALSPRQSDLKLSDRWNRS